ncbi:MAG: glycosyltransferase, partial [archaeon]|nr:glycosyltransferase [archaeon]
MEDKIELRLPPLIGLGNDYSYLEKIYEEYWGDEKNKPYLKVSVVIPVYNRKEILGKTLAGILHQTYPLELIEVIIADDGSSDHPEELIEIFEPFFDIRYVRQDDLGYRLSAVRNLGVKNSKNEHIIILDCDMLPMPDLVSSMMKWLHISDKIILIGHRRFVSTDGFSIEQCITDIEPILNLPDINSENQIVTSGSNGITIDWREKIYDETNQLKNAGRHVFRTFCGGNVGFSISAWNEIGIFDEDFNHWGGEDTEFGFRAYNKGYWFIPVKEALALHQEPPGGENETDRFEGKKITHEILIEKCPSRYRKFENGRQYEIPKVSVFIPAYNCEDFIEDAINSVLKQNFSDFEILITDDGGNDNTVKIIKKMMKKDKRIRFFPKENGGIGSACNFLLKHAKGEYALQLDGDDVLLPETISNFVEILDNNEIGFVYGDCFLVDAKLNFTKRSYSWSIYDRRKMIDGGMHVHPPRMFRLRDYHRTSRYNEKFENAVDFDFFLKLAEVSDGYHYQKSLYLYRKHGKNTSDTKSDVQTKNSILAVRESVDRLGIAKMVEIQSDIKNERRLHVKPKFEMNGLLDCKSFNQKFGVRCSSHLKLTILDAELICDKNTLKRSEIVTATSNLRRKLRIGPSHDIRQLIEIKEQILKEKGWNLHHQTLTRNLDSPLFLVTGHFGDEKSAQNASEFIRNLGYPTEIISSDKQHPFSYPSKDNFINFLNRSDTKKKLDLTEISIKNDEDTIVIDMYNSIQRWVQ